MFGYLGSHSGLLDEFRRLGEELERLHDSGLTHSSIRSAASRTFPPINIGATEEQVDVFVYAAGLDPDTLDISLQQNVLSIAGERTTEREDNSESYRRERYSGSFRRVISLPEDIDPDRVEASYRDGVLRIQIMRRESSRPRRIEVS